MPPTANLPSRLHHTAYTTKDMDATHKFYEAVIGLPLVARANPTSCSERCVR
jgi:glyoxylase I family protein